MAHDHRVVVIQLWPSIIYDDCPICGHYRRLDHAVGWYCGPVRQNPGEQVPGWRGEAIAGGMSVCGECHDGFYAEQPASPLDVAHEAT